MIVCEKNTTKRLTAAICFANENHCQYNLLPITRKVGSSAHLVQDELCRAMSLSRKRRSSLRTEESLAREKGDGCPLPILAMPKENGADACIALDRCATS